ncbi:MAG TPA: hypothetical protein PL041_15620 [Melioribacteraceae bacterium]|nr:hypothetical protein [Melioribacteraceae bacterium]
MKVNKISASMFILFLVLLFSCNKNLEESTKKMKATVNLEGIWQYTYFEDNDTIITNIEELPFIKFEGQTFVVSKNEKIIQRGTYKVTLSNEFNKLNISIVEGDNYGINYKAIYNIVDDSLLTINYGKESFPNNINSINNGFIVRLEKIK